MALLACFLGAGRGPRWSCDQRWACEPRYVARAILCLAVRRLTLRLAVAVTGRADPHGPGLGATIRRRVPVGAVRAAGRSG